MVEVRGVVSTTIHTEDGPVPGAMLSPPSSALVLLDAVITALAEHTGHQPTDVVLELRDVVDGLPVPSGPAGFLHGDTHLDALLPHLQSFLRRVTIRPRNVTEPR
jgi:hypothetical protein